MTRDGPALPSLHSAWTEVARNWSHPIDKWRRLMARLRRRRPSAAASSEPFSALARSPEDLGDLRPHLLVLVPWLPMGGAEVLLADILDSLKAEWRLSIVTTETGDQALAPAFAAITTEIYHLPDLVERRHWFEFVAALMASRDSKAILSSGSRFLYKNLKRIKARFPAILSYDILHNDAPKAHLASALRARLHIHRLIAVNERIGRSLARGGASPGTVVVIPNGVDYEGVFNPQGVDLGAARRRFGIGDGTFVIGFVGRMSEEKRPLAFLAVVAPILAAHANVRVLVLGDGKMKTAFRDAARAAGIADRVHHLPRVDRAAMPQFYAACGILVMSSRIEGTPLVMLEALAMGCPVATTDVGDAALVIREGINGFIVPVAAPEALTPRIAGLVGDEAALERMRAAARQSIVDTGRSADAMLAAYRALMRPSRQSP
ncbi:glycosyltransferase family 4 protein [Mesorhizobium sp. B2-7-1]|uniref:glycosyltransferase family 4 protein n=1 Tax=Mesorhizobium sp. B2-7-1 TaxID=2589909 RepID=UPI00112C58E7|nr:glycosyltransferase family 4 protein [Mesorhizobium sp. B2-7-1]TPJ48630.1 glycosyltransferase family 4 protein [Mesorhizobium sp. B2-7-1]